MLILKTEDITLDHVNTDRAGTIGYEPWKMLARHRDDMMRHYNGPYKVERLVLTQTKRVLDE